MFRKIIFASCYTVMILALSGCGATKKINLFPVEQDITLGLQVSQQIESDTKQFPILAEQGNEKLYKYVRDITDKILNSGSVKHKDDFAWQVKIIDDIETLNAFCTPGGYIYVYTGLINYLESEDELAGVMGHEIAHADLRHSTRQMTKVYGVQVVGQIITGKAEPGMIEQIALGLTSLKFGRGHETESDAQSVKYLCGTDYNAAGAAGFFEKIVHQGGSRQPAFLSTHPDPGNRVESIHGKKTELGCSGTNLYKERYAQMKALIPNSKK